MDGSRAGNKVSVMPNSAIDGRLAVETHGTPEETAKPVIKDQRKVMAENYHQVDDKFLTWKRPKNPFDYIDRKTKKIDINPGEKYISSSQQEVLEPRLAKMLKAEKNKISKFLKPLNDVQTYQDEYIEPLFDAYQLKTVYSIKDVEQVEFDSDDEDNLILAIQPYDTVQSVGFSHMLQHLPTKFLTRRSDIIVSSTMSITLTP